MAGPRRCARYLFSEAMSEQRDNVESSAYEEVIQRLAMPLTAIATRVASRGAGMLVERPERRQSRRHWNVEKRSRVGGEPETGKPKPTHLPGEQRFDLPSLRGKQAVGPCRPTCCADHHKSTALLLTRQSSVCPALLLRLTHLDRDAIEFFETSFGGSPMGGSREGTSVT